MISQWAHNIKGDINREWQGGILVKPYQIQDLRSMRWTKKGGSAIIINKC